MIEIMCEQQPRPAIPAVLRLRARYRGRRADYARDKLWRNQQMALRRPTMGDRMDKAAEAKFRREQDELDRAAEKEQRREEAAAARLLKKQAEDQKLYRGR